MPSIHPSLLVLLIRGQVTVAAAPAGCPRPPSHHQHFSAPPGQPGGAILGQLEYVIPSESPGPRGPDGCAKNTLKVRHPGSASVGLVPCLHCHRGRLRPCVHLLLCHSVTHEQDPQVLERPGLGQFIKGVNGPLQIGPVPHIPAAPPTENPRTLGCKPSPDPQSTCRRN